MAPPDHTFRSYAQPCIAGSHFVRTRRSLSIPNRWSCHEESLEISARLEASRRRSSLCGTVGHISARIILHNDIIQRLEGDGPRSVGYFPGREGNIARSRLCDGFAFQTRLAKWYLPLENLFRKSGADGNTVKQVRRRIFSAHICSTSYGRLPCQVSSHPSISRIHWCIMITCIKNTLVLQLKCYYLTILLPTRWNQTTSTRCGPLPPRRSKELMAVLCNRKRGRRTRPSSSAFM